MFHFTLSDEYVGCSNGGILTADGDSDSVQLPVSGIAIVTFSG